VVAELAKVMHAPVETLRLPLLCLLAEGHVLVEDVPGVGKTVLAKALARTLDLRFSRLQFTPDLLPSDVTGVNVYDQQAGRFRFRPGPVFANVLLVDEVNRASPKTQSALLEAMQETQVTVDGETYELDRPFLAIATQNPLEYEGTYPLPEAQLDRFAVRMSIGYPPLPEEARMLAEQTGGQPLDALGPVAGRADITAAIAAARDVYVEESVTRYVVALLRHTRANPRLALGASPRSGIALLRLAKARALVERRGYVTPEDIGELAEHVLSHRMLLAPEARSAGLGPADVVREALESTPVPV
jgi:MoxR-like ATPase